MPELRRREMIALGARGFLTLGALLPFLGCSPRASTAVGMTPLDWQQFIDQVGALGEIQAGPGWNEAAQVDQVRALLMRLALDDQHLRAATARYVDAHRNFPEITELHRQRTFQVSLLEFAPGERIPLHDHPDMSGCMRCSEGRVVVRNFTLIQRPAPQDRVLLRQESVIPLVPGMAGTLTSTTGNIHDLVAESFTRLIDVFTPPYDGERIRRSRWFKLDPGPGADGLFTASVRA